MTNWIKSTFICTRIQNYVSYLKNFVDYKFLNEINFSNVHFFRRIFQRKILANSKALVGMAGGVQNYVKVLVKVLFSDNNSNVFE